MRGKLVLLCRTVIRWVALNNWKVPAIFMERLKSIGCQVQGIFSGLLMKKMASVGGALGFTAVISILWVGYFVVLRLGTTVVLVKAVTLPEKYIHAGYSQSVFTENLVGSVQALISMSQKEGVVGLTFPRAPEKRTTCLENVFPLEDLRVELLRRFPIPEKVEVRVSSSSGEDPESWMVAVGITALKMLGKTGATIVADVREDDGGALVFKATATFPSGKRYASEVRSLAMKGLEEKAQDQLFKFAAPWLYAALKFLDDPDGAELAITIIDAEFPNAIDRSLLYAAQGYSKYFRQVYSQPVTNAEEAREYFSRALGEDRDSYIALIGSAMSNLDRYGELRSLQSNREAVSQKMRGGNSLGTDGEPPRNYSRDEDDLRELRLHIIRQLERAIESEPRRPVAYYFLAGIYYDDKSQVEADRYRSLFLLNSVDPRGAFLSLAELFLGMDQLELAEGEISHASEYSAGGDSEGEARLLVLRARLHMARESWDSFRVIIRQIEQLRAPCSQKTIAVLLQEEGVRSAKKTGTKMDFLEEAQYFYSLAEESGMRGFHFYNSWGTLLQGLGRNDLAIEKYSRALEFYGDHSWALLNWGYLLSHIKQYQEAEKKYSESIAWGLTPAAVKGYLRSVFHQAKYQEFIDRYGLYKRKIDLGQEFIFEVGYSYCSVGRVKEAKEFLGKIPFGYQTHLRIMQLKSCIRDLKE